MRVVPPLIVLVSICRPGIAAEPTGWQPLVTLCIERVLRAADLAAAEETDLLWRRLRDGTALLSRLEQAAAHPDLEAWNEVVPYLDDTILAIEADAVLSRVIDNLPPDPLTLHPWLLLQQQARRRVLEALVGHYRAHGAEGGDLTDAREAERICRSILDDLKTTRNRDTEASILSRLARLGEAAGYPALEQAVRWLGGVLAAAENNGQSRVAAVTRAMLARVYLRLLREADGPHSDEALALLRYVSGGDARQFVADVEALRAGRSPFAVWLNLAMRATLPDDTTRAQALAEARAEELGLGALDGRPFPRSVSVDLLWMGLESRPPRLGDGTLLERRKGDIEQRTLLLLAALCVDDRAQSDFGLLALDRASLLVGDPRVDAGSLLDWVQSLFGERRGFGEEQFVRFLQEANAVLAEVARLSRGRVAVLSREYRKRVEEPLGPSFDLWIVDETTYDVVEAVEIKQTDRPRRASDLGGILRQATGKLEGEIVPLSPSPDGRNVRFRFDPGAPAPRLRHLLARRVLVIQIPWTHEETCHERGGLTFVSRPDGTIERRRSRDGALVGTDDLFAEIARHFPKVSDVDYFDEIRLTDPNGRAVVTFLHRRDPTDVGSRRAVTEGDWRVLRD